jgi:hypothetical protein
VQAVSGQPAGSPKGKERESGGALRVVSCVERAR